MICYLVREEGAWKFDWVRSMEMMFGGTGKSRGDDGGAHQGGGGGDGEAGGGDEGGV